MYLFNSAYLFKANQYAKQINTLYGSKANKYIYELQYIDLVAYIALVATSSEAAVINPADSCQ